MKMKTLVLILAGLLAAPALAADHLYPEPSIFGGDAFGVDYDQQIAATLKDAMEREVILRMIFVPSFVPESAVGIRKRGGQFEIFSLHPAEQIWNYAGRHAGKVKIGPDGKIDGSEALDLGRDDPKRMSVRACSVGVSPALEGTLASAWERSLRLVRSDGERDFGADGAVYHFAMRKNPADKRYMPEFLAGQIWSGPMGPRTRALIDIAETMDRYCETRDTKTLSDLTGKAQDLIKAIH